MSEVKKKPSTTNVVDEERFKQEQMFKDEWMNRCYKKVALPNAACEKVLGKVNDALAKRLKKTSGSPKHQQALFTLLGHNFVKDNFPDRKYDPSVLEKLPAEEKKKLLEETKATLAKETEAAVQDIGMPKNVTDYEDNDDLGAYLREVRSTFRSGLDEEVQKEVENFGKKKAEAAEKTAGQITQTKKADPEQCRNAIVGKTLLTLMEFDPSLKSEIENQFKGKIQVMPNPIRQKVYMEHLFQKELNGKLGKPIEQVNEELLKKQKDIVTKRVKDLQIERATRSTASKEIDKMVIRAYDFSSGFDSIKNDDEHMMQASRVLNVIHVINKTVQPAQVFWLSPFQLAFGKNLEEEDDNDMLKLALLLDLACEHLKLPLTELHVYADEIMKALKKEDPEYHTKIGEAQKNKVKPNIKEFNEECISKNQLQAEKIYKEMLAAQGQNKVTENVPENLVPTFADPEIFIRKWLSQGFAGVLNMNAIMMTWDYLFLNKWSKRAVMNVALGILGLIRPWMQRATGYTGIRKVFLEEPAKLYTADLRKSYQHLEKNNSSIKGLPQSSNFIEAPPAPPKPATPPPIRKPLSPPPKRAPLDPNLKPFDLDINLDSDDEGEEPTREPMPDAQA